MINTSYSPYGSNTGSGQGAGINEFLSKYNLIQQQQQTYIQSTPISELDEFLGSLTTDKRNAVETSQEYQAYKGRLFEKFLTYQIAMTTNGSAFLGTVAGRKMAQDLLDSAQRVANNFESNSRNELEEMKDLIMKQSSEIQMLKSRLGQDAFSNSQQASVINNDGVVDFSAGEPTTQNKPVKVKKEVK